MSLTVFLLFLLFISGVVAQDGWAVNYHPKSICALKGSTETMFCTYRYPSDHRVQKVFWSKELVTTGSEPPDLLADLEYRGRVQYLGDEHSDCSLRFKTVTEKDQSKYYFTFITDQPGGKYQGAGGVDLSVTDLQVEVPERVIEGDKVTLTCRTTCNLTLSPTFTWYRNGHHLSSSTDQLHLQPVSRKYAGRRRERWRKATTRTLTLMLRTTRTQLLTPCPGPLMMCTTQLQTLTLMLRTTRTQLLTPCPGPLMMCTTHSQLFIPVLLMICTQLWILSLALLSTTL
ncbi:uncharacterized protein LOC118797961 [Colossoma macropomum]|uniref:uncharacterized protein LOC118797961 n=1 Tax=Colossoma macropomum TaxID=42526 RepID=UPI001864B61E|nr:uncharacterized protein LOC118797961 [Colossoma macropomum]